MIMKGLTIVMKYHLEICRGPFYLPKNLLRIFVIYGFLEKYWHQIWCQIWNSPKLVKNTFYAHFEGFGHYHIWCQNWHQYVWTSLCPFIFLWTSSIAHVFEFLTFDIFLTIWHIFDNLTSFWQIDALCKSQLVRSRWGTGVMGHMGDRVHE